MPVATIGAVRRFHRRGVRGYGLGQDGGLIFPPPMIDPSLLPVMSPAPPSATIDFLNVAPSAPTVYGPPALPSTLVADAMSPGYLNPNYVPPGPASSIIASGIQAAGNILTPRPSPTVAVPPTALRSFPQTVSSSLTSLNSWISQHWTTALVIGAAIVALSALPPRRGR
jgi:hypothetical protein